MRKTLSAPGLLKEVRACFNRIEDPSRGLNQTDCLMSGLAVFGMKCLLKFDDAVHEAVLSNLETLYGVGRVPSDTRERLDEVDPRQLRYCFTKLFQLLQRGKELEGYTYLNEHYVLSIDGTGYFSSDKVHCQNCCEKHRRDGTTTYYHVGSRSGAPEGGFPVCARRRTAQERTIVSAMRRRGFWKTCVANIRT